MSIRTLSLTLNLDNSQFTSRARDTDGVMRTLSRGIDMTAKSLKEQSAAYGSTVSSMRAYTENNLRLKQSQDQLRASQDQFVKGLLKQLDTMGMSANQLRDYTAQSLGLTQQTRDLIAALDEKELTIRGLVEAEQAEIAAIRETVLADAERLDQSEALLNSMREQIVTLRGGAEALALEKAEALGCAEEFKALSGIVMDLTLQHREATAVMQAFGLTALDDAAAVEKLALAEREAGELALSNAVNYREGSAAMAGFGRSAHGSTGAIVEMNRIMHEASRGAFSQMTGSITILMNRLGAAGGLTLAIGVTIGVLHAMIKPVLDIAKSMEQMTRSAQELGVSLDFMENLKVVSELTGVSLDKMTSGLVRLDASFARARAGSKQTAAGFKQLGIDIKANYTPEELLAKTAEGLAKAHDKTALAVKVFGRAGAAMIPFLVDYNDRMKQANDLAEEYGLHNKTAETAALQLAAAQHENKVAMDGLSRTFIEALGPMMTNIVQGFSDLAKAFMDSYKAGGMAKGVMSIMAVIVKGLVSILVVAGLVIYDLVKGIDALAWAIEGVGYKAYEGWIELIGGTISAVSRLMQILDDLAHHDFGAAKQHWSDFFKGIGDDAAKAADPFKKKSDAAFGKMGNAVKDTENANSGSAKFLGNLWTDGGKKYKTPTTPKAGVLNDDDPTAAGKTKQNPAQEALNGLNAQLAELKGKLTDTGSVYQKWLEKLGNDKDPVAIAVKGHKDLADAIKLAAQAIDQANGDLADKALVGEWKKKFDEASDAAKDLWAQYDSGISKSQAATAKLRAEIDQAVKSAKSPTAKAEVQASGNGLIAADTSKQGAEAATDFREKTKQINAELAGDTLQKQRDIVAGEAKAAYERIALMDMTSAEGMKAYGDYAAYVEALNRKANAETPWGKMAQEWGDMTGNMQKSSAQWMDSFVSDMSKGKINFKEFATSVISDITSIIIKAIMAQYVIKPLLSAFGIGTGALGGASGSMSIDSSMTGAGDLSSSISTMLAHGGGMVGVGGMTRSVDPSVFQGAWKYHTGGIAGLRPDEVPAILQQGEGVFTQQQMKNMARGGAGSGQAPVQINLNNQSGTALDADHSGTSFDGEKYVLDVVVSHLSRPGALRNAIKSSQ